MMLEMFSHGFMIRALMAGMITGALCATLSVFIVLKRLSFMGVGVSHSAFGGVAIGVLLGVNPTWSALVFSIGVALLIGWISRRGAIHEDVSVGIVFASSMALGVALIGMAQGYNTDLFSYLFGSILAVTWRDLAFALVAFVIVLGVTGALFKELVAYCFDEQWARASGINVNRLQDTLLVLTAITVVVSMKLLGVVLASALLVIPGATGYALTESYRTQMGVSVLCALVSVVVGLTLSYYLDVASGAVIVLSSAFIFLIAVLLSPKGQ